MGFSRFLNGTNGTKSRKLFQLIAIYLHDAIAARFFSSALWHIVK